MGLALEPLHHHRPPEPPSPSPILFNIEPDLNLPNRVSARCHFPSKRRRLTPTTRFFQASGGWSWKDRVSPAGRRSSWPSVLPAVSSSSPSAAAAPLREKLVRAGRVPRRGGHAQPGEGRCALVTHGRAIRLLSPGCRGCGVRASAGHLRRREGEQIRNEASLRAPSSPPAARTVKCVNRNLTEVPAELPAYVRTLFLTGNRLEELPAGAFSRRPPLAELAALNLSASRLHTVRAGAFQSLPGLRQLDLSHNPLSDLSPLAFAGADAGARDPAPLEELILSHVAPPALRGLRRLELAGNRLLHLPRDLGALLPGLRHLDLRNNSLVSLGAGALRNLSLLESLHLEDNALKVLHNATLAELRGLARLTLFLDDNPWVCDCHMVDMVTWLQETEAVRGKARLRCAFPEKMRDRRLLELDGADLDCDPILPPSLQTSYVFLGIVLALIGAIFLLVLYLNRKGIKKWVHNIRDACRDHMEGYHYRYEVSADPRLTNLSSNSDV
ncbi:PREDICTED: trophoblast glycoprotein [Dipodomys ordii]|uniref:Trophoblast glycoprotein n=1 Tax=Dipodomys ordii TaxID=10020 RepID=A0A1S3GI71_DIPOR|nr:PREDICTED: trophoblast glycoprotein [Dipodomys ordii]